MDVQLEVADWVSFGRLQLWRHSQRKTKWPMKTRREEEAITAWPTGSGGVVVEHLGVLAKVDSGLMKEHSWLDAEVSRDLHLN
jgi:hypothetical protein